MKVTCIPVPDLEKATDIEVRKQAIAEHGLRYSLAVVDEKVDALPDGHVSVFGLFDERLQRAIFWQAKRVSSWSPKRLFRILWSEEES
ncbi:hypothetical protein ABE205_24200 [Brevibacillus agri]|uniref:hypothetical protein n=1 Tax=Brevibacillus TaxID=55080 RepID=UPI00068FF1CE|nr:MULTISPECIES: hypothetical protein [Brevibacillus]MDN4095166.1 hypothetical protein [Brevibacillus agri]